LCSLTGFPSAVHTVQVVVFIVVLRLRCVCPTRVIYGRRERMSTQNLENYLESLETLAELGFDRIKERVVKNPPARSGPGDKVE
jgi:hypothetical protein